MEYKIEDFEKIVEKLFSEKGCPWDKRQTFLSMRQSLLSEAYELIDAIEKDDIESIKEETGDLLLVALLYIFVGENNNKFSREEIYKLISEKMIHRHPHVFKDHDYSNWDWDKLKEEEKQYSSKKEILELIPNASPALIKADEVNKKMKKYFQEEISIKESQEFIKNNITSVEEENLAKCLYHMSNIIINQDMNSEIILNSHLNKKIKEL